MTHICYGSFSAGNQFYNIIGLVTGEGGATAVTNLSLRHISKFYNGQKDQILKDPGATLVLMVMLKNGEIIFFTITIIEL